MLKNLLMTLIVLAAEAFIFTERFGNYMLLIQGQAVHNEASRCCLIINVDGLRCHALLRHYQWR
jgi:hypothetical protein